MLDGLRPGGFGNLIIFNWDQQVFPCIIYWLVVFFIVCSSFINTYLEIICRLICRVVGDGTGNEVSRSRERGTLWR